MNTRGGFVVRLGLVVSMLVAAVPAAATLASQQTSAGDWPQFQGGPHRSGHNEVEEVLGRGNVTSLTVDWTAPGTDSLFDSSPVVSGGLLYVNNYGDGLRAYDASTGALRWTSEARYLNGSPAVAEGLVYSNCGGASVCAFDAATGAKRWTSIIGPFSSYDPAVSGGIVYVADEFGLNALRASTGAPVWDHQTEGPIFGSPSVAAGVAYVGSSEGGFWGTGSVLYALNAATGSPLWTKRIPDGLMNATPAVVDGRVFAAVGSEIYAFDAQTGKELWKVTPGETYWSIDGSPAVAGGVVYVAAGSTVHALRASDGDELWGTRVGQDGIDSSLAIANGVLYVGRGDGGLEALRADTGRSLWSHAMGARDIINHSSPVVANGRVYFDAEDETVVSLSTASGTGGGPPAPTEPADNPLLLVHGFDWVASSGESGAKWDPLKEAFAEWGYEGPILVPGYYENDTGIDADIGDHPASDPDRHSKHLDQEDDQASEHTGEGQEQHNKNTDIRHLAYHFAWYVHDEFSSTGQPVNVVAHSMGGLITRYALSKAGTFGWPDELLVEEVVTFGTPHGGTELKCPVDQCRQMGRRSLFIQDLKSFANNPQGSTGTEWTIMGSYSDEALAPDESAVDDDMDAAHRVMYLVEMHIRHGDYRMLTSVERDADLRYAVGASAWRRFKARKCNDSPWPVRWMFLTVSRDFAVEPCG